MIVVFMNASWVRCIHQRLTTTSSRNQSIYVPIRRYLIYLLQNIEHAILSSLSSIQRLVLFFVNCKINFFWQFYYQKNEGSDQYRWILNSYLSQNKPSYRIMLKFSWNIFFHKECHGLLRKLLIRSAVISYHTSLRDHTTFLEEWYFDVILEILKNRITQI